jgi:predicted phage tail component-like protein
MSFTMSFNGHVLPIRISKVEGRGPINQQVNRRTLPNGEILIGKVTYTEKYLKIHYSIAYKNFSECQQKVDDLNVLLSTKDKVPIIFSDEPSKTYYGIPDGEQSWEEFYAKGKGIINIVRDQCKYGQEKTTTSTTIVNEGSAPCTPVFNVEFTSSASEFRIQNEDGKFVRVIWTFVAGDRLVVDFKKRKISINFTVRMTSLDFSSNWFDLRPGENKLTVTPSGVAATTINYTPRWL